MAAPVATLRQNPTGIKLVDGQGIHITFAINPSVAFWEKSIKPPAINGGDPIQTTNSFNISLHTFSPRTLKKYDEVTVKAFYDPKMYAAAQALVNIETTVTVAWPDGSTFAAFGFCRMFDPSEVAEGVEPDCTLTVVISNWDPVNRVEAQPVYVDVPGT